MKKLKISIIAISSILLLSVVGFFVYVNVYYKADETALAILEENENITIIDNLLILSPDEETDNGIGIMFYPGAKVESTAYLPILDKLRDEGFTCVLIEMPFNMAIFNVDAGDDVFELNLDIESWYIMGHSMGGSLATSYAADNQDKLDGAILLGAYIYGDYPAEDALTIYGTFNSNLEEKMDYTENIVIIDGGNHAQFGNYGKQDGDPDATITADEQQNIAVDAIVEFILGN